MHTIAIIALGAVILSGILHLTIYQVAFSKSDKDGEGSSGSTDSSDNGNSNSDNGNSNSDNGNSNSDNGNSNSDNGNSNSDNGNSNSDNGNSNSDNGNSNSETGQTPDGQGGPENATVPQEQQGGPAGPENQTGQTPAGTNGQTGTEQTNPANPTGPPTTFPSQQGGPETATGPQTTQNNLAPTSPTTGGQPTKTVSSEQFQSTLKSALTSEGIQSAQLANAATQPKRPLLLGSYRQVREEAAASTLVSSGATQNVSCCSCRLNREPLEREPLQPQQRAAARQHLKAAGNGAAASRFSSRFSSLLQPVPHQQARSSRRSRRVVQWQEQSAPAAASRWSHHRQLSGSIFSCIQRRSKWSIGEREQPQPQPQRLQQQVPLLVVQSSRSCSCSVLSWRLHQQRSGSSFSSCKGSSKRSIFIWDCISRPQLQQKEPVLPQQMHLQYRHQFLRQPEWQSRRVFAVEISDFIISSIRWLASAASFAVKKPVHRPQQAAAAASAAL